MRVLSLRFRGWTLAAKASLPDESKRRGGYFVLFWVQLEPCAKSEAVTRSTKRLHPGIALGTVIWRSPLEDFALREGQPSYWNFAYSLDML
jgi:hypothetical protein